MKKPQNSGVLLESEVLNNWVEYLTTKAIDANSVIASQLFQPNWIIIYDNDNDREDVNF